MAAELSRASTAETLEYLHHALDAHFARLYDRRRQLHTPAPVFALEHGLGGEDLVLLQTAVRAAHQEHLLSQSGRWWLPFVVHAAEVGYIYDGVEYWPIYAKETPDWIDSQHERERVRDWFTKFTQEYGGAVPQGAWAKTFRKIAWPITHAVLPRYLQAQLAHMLSDYRTAWPGFLDRPAELGIRLHSWSRRYSDRLEKFCQNTELAGRIAVALVTPEDGETSPYIEMTALARIVESLNGERQSRRWLRDARHSASTERTHNFRPEGVAGSKRAQEKRLPPTDPKLHLLRERGVWKAYAALPDLLPLQHALPSIYDELREHRAIVSGSPQTVPGWGLLYATRPVELATWPSPADPFLQLQRASQEANLLLAEQCRITSGPWWVFRCTLGAPATEVKGKAVRPGSSYCIVGAPELVPPGVAWCQPAEIAVEGVRAYDLQVPTFLSDSDVRALVSSGLSVISDVSIRPVGVVASSWDGEGSAEWLAGEPTLIAVHAQRAPRKVRLTINSEPYQVEWPAGETDLFLCLDGLDVGVHEIAVSLGDPDGDGRKTGGTLLAIIRDPQVQSEGAAAGEAIRLRTAPAQPSLPELWDGHAVVELDGPRGATVDLAVTLCDGDGVELDSPHRRSLVLPVNSDNWRRFFPKLREGLAKHYDEADVARLEISRAGVGFATLTCERGFQGLRWVLSARHREGGYAARLIDRTDGDPVTVDFCAVEHPLVAHSCAADQVFVNSSRGGLLWASNGEEVAGQIVPPDPNQLRRLGPFKPSVPTAQKSLLEIDRLIFHHRRWRDAQLPAHPFGMRERKRVLDAITRALAMMLTAGRWARFEERMASLDPEDGVDLDMAQALVGESQSQRDAAESIAKNQWRWDSTESFIEGFHEATRHLISSSGMPDTMRGARLLLQLASSPGELLDWDEEERTQYQRCILDNPVLVRAARYAVLGSIEEVAGGVG